MFSRSHSGQRWRQIPNFAGCLAVLASSSIAFMSAVGGHPDSPFAATVIAYSPAPGRFVQDLGFTNPMNAIGSPEGMGTYDGNNVSVVTLGGFGGSITLAFDHTVLDDPLNPFGMDAIVFGNAFWRDLDPERHWAECATIEISLDANGNGLADDAWYLIPGSHIVTPVQSTVATWDDEVTDASHPPTDSRWIPPNASGQWTTSAFALPAALFGVDVVVNPFADSGNEGIFGYADYTPTLYLGDLDADDIVDDADVSPEEFYTVPDDPFEVGISLGSGGGDAFDVAWAVDPESGKPAELHGFDFIRLTTAVNALSRLGLGEKSAEIDAVADVAVDPLGDYDGDEDVDLFDAAGFQWCLSHGEIGLPACRVMTRGDGSPTLADWASIARRATGPLERLGEQSRDREGSGS